MSNLNKAVTVLAILAIIICVITVVAVHQKNQEILTLKLTLKTQETANSTTNYEDMELYGFSTDELFYKSSRNGKNYYIIKNEDLKYWYYGYVDQEYSEGRSKEWLSALKTAVDENAELKEDLRSTMSYMIPWSLEKDDQEKFTDESLSIFLDRLRILPTGELYVYGEDEKLYDTDVFIRGSVRDPDNDLGWGLYIFFPAISY